MLLLPSSFLFVCLFLLYSCVLLRISMSTQSKAMVQCKDPRCDGGDDPNMPVWYCATCRTSYCDRCWNFANVHQSANMVEGTAPHEQLDHRRYIQCKRLEKILSPPNSHEEIEKLHHRDANTTWFGKLSYRTDLFKLTHSFRYREV